MKIAVLADATMKACWQQRTFPSGVETLWCGSVKTLVATVADVYVDLLFTHDRERTKDLSMRSGFPFFINSVDHTCHQIGDHFIRINGWPGFLERSVLEIAVGSDHDLQAADQVLKTLQWEYKVAPDLPGLITARVVASIVNEAYYTYGEGTSSREEIDTAMKLGTNYPYGPFEWAEKIGIEKIYSLLKELSRTDNRYSIAPALEKEIWQRHSQ